MRITVIGAGPGGYTAAFAAAKRGDRVCDLGAGTGLLGLLLLARQGKTRKDALKQAVNQLKLTDAKLLGYVLNGVDMQSGTYYTYQKTN